MTTTDKAREMIMEYIGIMPCLVDQTGYRIIKHAKQCCLIAIDKILSDTENVQYWQEVKDEVEKY